MDVAMAETAVDVLVTDAREILWVSLPEQAMA